MNHMPAPWSRLRTGLAMWGRHPVCRLERHLADRNTRQGCPVNRPAGSLTHFLRLALSLLTIASLLLWDFSLSTSCGQSVPPPVNLREGLFHEVFEKDRGRFFQLTPSTTAVDANADLIISFQTPSTVEPGSPGLGWQQASNALEFVRENVRRRLEFTAQLPRVPLNDAAAVTNFTSTLRAFNRESVQRLREIRDRSGISTSEWDLILDGDFDNHPTPRPYENLGRWLTNRIATLRRELERFAADHTVQVTVQAFHLPRKGAQQPVHVENYDMIPAGEYRPIDRLGLQMNEAEQQEFAAKLQAAKAGADAIREIKTNSKELRGYLQSKLDEVRKKLEELEKMLENEAADWQADFTTTATAKALQALAADAGAGDGPRAAARELLDDLGKFNSDFREASTLFRKVGRLIGQVRRGSDAGLFELATALMPVSNEIKKFTGDAKALLVQVNEWKARLERTRKNSGIVAARLEESVRTQVFPQAVDDFVAGFSEKFPATAAALELAASVLSVAGSDNGANAALGAVAELPTESVWLDAAKALPGTVELSRTGLAPGDAMKVKISYREPGTNGVPGRLIASDDYKLEAVLMGMHRKFDATVIFARGLRGADEEQDWKPNVAATVTWHYRIRKEPDRRLSFSSRTWNWFNPGLGLHMASLDQGNDSVEFGAGVNLSLWDGVLQGGYGFNLSNDEKPYVFFGLGLLQTLEKAKGLKQ